MKRFILLLAMTAIVCTAEAQSTRSGQLQSWSMEGVYHKTPDTLTAPDTVLLGGNTGSDNNQWNVALQYWSGQLTGTVTTTAYVQGSNNATAINTGTWYTIGNCTTCQVKGLSDTGKVTNTAYDFLYPNCAYKYLRIMLVNGGSGTSVPYGYYWKWQPLLNY